MIVVAFIAILTIIAFPKYQNEVVKGERAEGKAALLQAAQIEERYYTSNNQYGTLELWPRPASTLSQAMTQPIPHIPLP
jgi:type IV pilus assembly protein PilE